MENIEKPSFLSKTGPRTKFVRENFCTRKLPITCRFQICTFWKTGLPDRKPDSVIWDIKIGIIHVWMVQRHIVKILLWYLQKRATLTFPLIFGRKYKNTENFISKKILSSRYFVKFSVILCTSSMNNDKGVYNNVFLTDLTCVFDIYELERKWEVQPWSFRIFLLLFYLGTFPFEAFILLKDLSEFLCKPLIMFKFSFYCFKNCYIKKPEKIKFWKLQPNMFLKLPKFLAT